MIAHMEEDRNVLRAKFEATMQRTVKETPDRFDSVHARLNEGNQNRRNKFVEVAAKVTEIEKRKAHRDPRTEMIQGMVQQMARGETFPPVHGKDPVPVPPINQHQSCL